MKVIDYSKQEGKTERGEIMDVIERVSHDLCLSPTDVRDLMGIIDEGVKHSPPKGFNMKKAGPVIDRMKSFLRDHGRGDELRTP